MSQDNRRQTRKKFTEQICAESLLTGASQKSVVAREFSGVNISDGGLGIITAHQWAVGDVIKLSLPLKGLGITVPVFTEVLWIKPFEDNYLAGLRFLA